MRSNKISERLKNRKIIITAGGTVEPIDPVRYIGNHSSGKMGIALANAFSKYCNNVILIYSNINITIPKKIKALPVKTVKQMHEKIKKHLTKDSILIMSAAVSDFKVKSISKTKIKKNKKITLELVPCIDILKTLSKTKTKKNIFIGFAVETGKIINNARIKLIEKKLDLIVANPVDKSNDPFGSDHNKVYLIDKDQSIELPRMKKTEIAREILKFVCKTI